MAKPFVVQVLWTLEPGGAERLVFDLARLLPAQGFDVQVVSACGGGAWENMFRAADIPLVIGPRTRNRLRTLAFLQARLRAVKPKVWHTHLGGDVWGGVVARAFGFHPWIITAHSEERTLPQHLHLSRRWAYRAADQVACVSQTVRDGISENYHPPTSRLSIIHAGVALERFPEVRRHTFHDVPRLITVGRLVAGKNHDVLLQGLARVRQPWMLEVVGDGPERTRLERLTLSLGLAPRVRFLGALDDPSERLRAADVFCFPSQSEGQGVAALEAMAAGLPVISSDLSALRETFDETQIMFVDPRSSLAWTHALSATLASPLDAFRRAHSARHIIEQKFSAAAMAEAYAELYRRCMV